MSFAEALERLFRTGDASAIAAQLLHRVQMEDGLALHIGRDAVVAELLTIAASFGDCDISIDAAMAPGFVGFAVSGILRQLPFGTPLAAPVPATLRRHLWIESEAGRAVRITAITDWAGLADTAGIARNPLAATIGAAHPAHRPLGELASGSGQLLALAPGADAMARRNARDFGDCDPKRRDWWLRLVARVPDAHFTFDRSIAVTARTAMLWRLQGHVGGRRVSLPGSSVVAGDGTETDFIDELALAATACRAFYDH